MTTSNKKSRKDKKRLEALGKETMPLSKVDDKERLQEKDIMALGSELKRLTQKPTSMRTGPDLKPHRRMGYKLMSVEVSCRKYLDALARRLSFYYDFGCKHTSPTIGDVLSARNGVENEDWDYCRAHHTRTVTTWDGFQMTIKKGWKLMNTPLPKFCTEEEWKNISKFNFKINELIHNATLPVDSKGRFYIVILHVDFTPDMVSFLKNTGVRATLFRHPEDLVVKDAEFLPEGEYL